MTTLTFAVLVDGENTQPQLYKNILDEIEKIGSIAIKWVYADWTSPYQKNWQDPLYSTASQPMQQFHYGKDAADHALIMDAIELTCTNDRINAICIVSSDGGFSGLAQRIREKGLHVMAIGKKETPPRFRSACHNFVYIDNLGENVSENNIVDNEHNGLDSLLLKAYWQLAENDEDVYLGDMGLKLKQIDSTFDSRTYGYKSLKKAIKNLCTQFEIYGEKEDRCYVRPTSLLGTLKLTPQGNNKFAFIVHEKEEFHFKLTDLNDNKQWKNLKTGINLKFQISSTQTGKTRSACNVDLY